jgi:ribose transport system substrate-binding protein
MMTRKIPFQLFAVGIVAVLAAGCKQDEPEKTGSAGSKNAPLQLAFVTNNASDYWTIARAGVEKAKKEDPSLTVDFRMPANGTPAEQKEILDDELAKGIKGIAISPVSPENEVDLINGACKKALVFTQDSDAANTDRACYIGTDNVEAGREVGAEIKKACPKGGKVMFFVGQKDAQNAKDRYNGIQEALKGSNIVSVDVRMDQADHAKAKSNVADAIVANPDLVCLVGLWSYNGPAIRSALKDANKLNQIKIVCFDEEDETLAGIRDGSISATVVQNPYEFGYQAVKMMAKGLRGDKSDIPPGKQHFIPTRVITKANVEDFAANLLKQRNGG